MNRLPSRAVAARENAHVNEQIAQQQRMREQVAQHVKALGLKGATLDLFDLDLDVIFEEESDEWIEDRLNEERPSLKDEVKAEFLVEERERLREEVRKELREELAEASAIAEENKRVAAENAALRARLATFAPLPSSRRKVAEIHELRRRVAELTANIATLVGAKAP